MLLFDMFCPDPEVERQTTSCLCWQIKLFKDIILPVPEVVTTADKATVSAVIVRCLPEASVIAPVVANERPYKVKPYDSLDRLSALAALIAPDPPDTPMVRVPAQARFVVSSVTVRLSVPAPVPRPMEAVGSLG